MTSNGSTVADSIDYTPDREHTAGEGRGVHLDVHGREEDVTGHRQQLVLLQTHLLKEAHKNMSFCILIYIYIHTLKHIGVSYTVPV